MQKTEPVDPSVTVLMYHNTNTCYLVYCMYIVVDKQKLLYRLGTILRQHFHNLILAPT
jgi:hypothetical protein